MSSNILIMSITHYSCAIHTFNLSFSYAAAPGFQINVRKLSTALHVSYVRHTFTVHQLMLQENSWYTEWYGFESVCTISRYAGKTFINVPNEFITCFKRTAYADERWRQKCFCACKRRYFIWWTLWICWSCVHSTLCTRWVCFANT